VRNDSGANGGEELLIAVFARIAIAASVAFLGAATATALAAQRVEIAARIGYTAPAGTQFRLANANPGSSSAVRSWDGGGLSVGAAASFWLNPHVGVQATADLRFIRHHATYDFACTVCVPIPGMLPPPVDTNAMQLVASLRLAARQGLGDRLQLGASVGPAMIRFGASEYRAPQTPGAGYPGPYFLAHRATYGVAVGLSAAYVVRPRVRLSLSADDVVYRAWPADASSWSAVAVPIQHELTFSAVAAVTVP
jgi:hypothetical protein